MTWVDLLIILIVVASGAFGVWRGFAKEAIALATWLAAIWLAWRSAWLVDPALGEWSVAPEARIWVARAIVFVVVLITGGLLAWLMREIVRKSGLSGTDRSLGGLFGILRAVLIIGLLTMFVQYSGLDAESWWQSARLRPLSERLADGVRYYVEIGSQYVEEEGLVRAEPEQDGSYQPL